MSNLSHPDKILFPADGITKADVAAYYGAIAPLMLPHIRQRPITMERFPAGIGRKGFIQKSVIKGFPEWLRRIEVPRKEGGTVHYPLANDRRSLLWMANQNAVTLHVWPSRLPRLDRPDLCVFDLDPSEDDPEVLRRTAIGLHDLLEEQGRTSWVKTSGSKGFHIVVPLKPGSTFGDSASFADRVAALLVARDPAHLTQEFSKADRGSRIFIDTGRNRSGATYAAPYTLRAKPGAPVSAPCTWDEIASGDVGPQTFTLRTMEQRIAAVGDLWKELRSGRTRGR